jgi:hypothetical protein
MTSWSTSWLTLTGKRFHFGDRRLLLLYQPRWRRSSSLLYSHM